MLVFSTNSTCIYVVLIFSVVESEHGVRLNGAIILATNSKEMLLNLKIFRSKMILLYITSS